MTQFHSWLQRRRQQHSAVNRRKSAMESKTSTSSTTPTLLGSPRLARLHQKIFKQSVPLLSQTNSTSIPTQILDDSDNPSQYEHPVRIYFPPVTTPPISHHVHTTDINIITSKNNNQDIQIEPTSSSSSSTSSSFKMATAKERRESFATLSNIFNKRHL